jgi:hypothetical protein
MNTHAITMATGPLVTEQAGVPSGLVFGFFLVMAGLLIIVVVISVATETEEVTAGGLLAGIALALVLMCFGISSIVDATKGEPFRVKVLSEERVTEVISDYYRITSIEDYEGLVTKESLCKPVSSESPEYTGVAKGQQIRFKAGSTNCESDNPDIRIIVTDTPGSTPDAENLRR